MNKLLLTLAVLALGLTASAQTPATTVATVPVCKTGADPVDPTYKWVPPTDWKLIKTDKLQEVTQTGGHGESTCKLPPGQVIAYPPNGGNPVVVLCKNEITKGRPTGTEIPRESVTFNVTPPSLSRDLQLAITGIPNVIGLDVNGEVRVIHSGMVDVNVHHEGSIGMALPPPPPSKGGSSWCGWKCKLLLGAALGVGAEETIRRTRGHHTGPHVTTLNATGVPPTVTTLPATGGLPVVTTLPATGGGLPIVTPLPPH